MPLYFLILSGEFFLMASSGTLILSSKKFEPTKQAFCFGCPKSLHEIVGNSTILYCSDLPNNLSRDVKGESFAERTEKCKILGEFFYEEVENWDDYCCPKFSISF